jgi:GNAT superfamily N-acetyltransferase
MSIIELKTPTDFTPAYPLIRQLNPAMSEEAFAACVLKMLPQGYRCIAWQEGSTYRGLCGFWQGTRFWCGDFIDLDNVVVDEQARGSGIGKKLLDWVEAEARRLGCQQLGLDCYTTSHDAHRFYFRQGYIIKGYHFIKPL